MNTEDERCHWNPPNSDTDISLWHDPDGLLQKIEEDGLIEQFTLELLRGDNNAFSDTDCGLIWIGCRANAPQLAAALLKVIGGGGVS